MISKKIILFLFPIFILNTLHAQEAIQNKVSPLDYKPSIIALEKQFSSRLHKFIFFDERDDTTRMGFFWGSNSQYYLRFPKAAATYLNEKWNGKKGNASMDTIYIAIKHLWISQVSIPVSITRSFLLSSNRTIGYCRLACNFYKKQAENYYLLYAYDSVVSKNGYLGNTKDKLMEENFSILREKADSITDNDISKNIYHPIKSLKPVLSSAKPYDGIYMTFDNFKNNSPVDIDFMYSSSNIQEKLIVKEKISDDSAYTEHCWGFCKNNVPYMRIGSRFSRLTKIENTFELRIAESVQDKYSKEFDAFWLGFNIGRDLKSGFPILALSDIISHKKPAEVIIRTAPFKLDMETGKVY